MRTFLTSFAAVVLALSFLSSCGTAAKDIDVTKLEEACDFADAMLTCATELDAMSSEAKEGEEPTEDQKAAAKVITDKMEAIRKAFDNTDLKMKDMKECPAFDKADKLMNK
jgi:glutamine synthetase type III